MASAGLETRFLGRLRGLGVGDAPCHLLVAVSGGRDSMVLLHLLRFAARALPLTLTVAHLDHALRPRSAADARWLRGVCRAWDLPLLQGRLTEPPRGEDAARRARHRFLRAAARRAGAEWIVTAHHADDQAETVLFRALRGTGLAGLAGMAERTGGGLLRPLLPFWREELARYARRAGLRWREDPTNRAPGPARNRIRHRLLPEAERWIAPGARRSLLSLAALAGEAESALEALARRAEAELVRQEGEALVLARIPLRAYDLAVTTRLLRRLLRRFGLVLGRTGTRTALQFITDAPSGRELQLPRGFRIRLEFDDARFLAPSAAADRVLDLPLPLPRRTAAGALVLGGRTYRVEYRAGRWTGEPPEPREGAWHAVVPLGESPPPLRLRGWLPGDRVRTEGGTKTLRKLFSEERVPRSRRHQLPVLAGAPGEVLWVAGSRRAPLPAPRPGADVLLLTITHD